MATYLCEDKSSCRNFQSAICLHCNLRLCISHITEHNQMIFRDVGKLSNELETTSQRLKEASEKTKFTFTRILSSLDSWRKEQFNRIEGIYTNRLETVTAQQQKAEQLCHQLLQTLDQDARQQLDEMKRQQNISIGALNYIKQTIENVRNESEKHFPGFITLPETDSNSNTNPIQQHSTSPDKEQIVLSKAKKKISSNTSRTVACVPFRRLVQLFASLSSIEQARNDIHTYIESQGSNFRLATLVCSYLGAWYKKSKLNDKILLLNEHIFTIRKYLTNSTFNYEILYGIQGFFHYIKVIAKEDSVHSIFKSNKKGEIPAEEMMTFLLQYFINHQCINKNLIRTWYHNRNKNLYKGYIFAKQLATPFILSIANDQTAHDVRTVSIDPLNVQRLEIKVEPYLFE
ncbi:hypothetical protein I4U23_012838 [Adineta vaga]|nr:hypothetical protein I4U23_012838 [Adineta vaga]